jgi:O-antigen/teichoic acid export membrane protein
VFGDRWATALDIFPFVGINVVGVSIISAQAAIFYARGHNHDVTRVNGCKLVLATAFAAVLTPWLHYTGYGLSLVLSLGAIFLSDRLMRAIVTPHYGHALMWAAAFVPPMFSPLLSAGEAIWLWVPTVVVLALPTARAQLREYLGLVISAVRRKPTPAAA